MKHAAILVRALDLDAIAKSAAAANLYAEAVGDAPRQPRTVADDANNPCPCFIVEDYHDRNGTTPYVRAFGADAVAWLNDLGAADAEAQKHAQDRARAVALQDELVKREDERAAERALVDSIIKARELGASQPSELDAKPAPSVSVTVTAPTDWQAQDVDEAGGESVPAGVPYLTETDLRAALKEAQLDEPTPPAVPKKSTKKRR